MCLYKIFGEMFHGYLFPWFRNGLFSFFLIKFHSILDFFHLVLDEKIPTLWRKCQEFSLLLSTCFYWKRFFGMKAYSSITLPLFFHVFTLTYEWIYYHTANISSTCLYNLEFFRLPSYKNFLLKIFSSHLQNV